jgi:hypothetical protein
MPGGLCSPWVETSMATNLPYPVGDIQLTRRACNPAKPLPPGNRRWYDFKGLRGQSVVEQMRRILMTPSAEVVPGDVRAPSGARGLQVAGTDRPSRAFPPRSIDNAPPVPPPTCARPLPATKRRLEDTRRWGSPRKRRGSGNAWRCCRRVCSQSGAWGVYCPN